MIQVAVGVPPPPMRITRAAPCSIHSNVTGPCTLASGSGRNAAPDSSMSQAPARNCNGESAGLWSSLLHRAGLGSRHQVRLHMAAMLIGESLGRILQRCGSAGPSALPGTKGGSHLDAYG